MFRLLGESHSVFLAAACLKTSETWDTRIPEAQASSRVTVVLISEATAQSPYVRAEIVAALRMARTDPASHRIAPVYLAEVREPYGLESFQALNLKEEGGWKAVAEKLRRIVSDSDTGNDSPFQTKSRPRQPLDEFPPGPLVPAYYLSRALIEAYADLFPAEFAVSQLGEANAYRMAANPDDPSVTVIKPQTLPSAEHSSPFVFWSRAFDEARRHGPKMLAALILTVEPGRLPVKAVAELLDKLRKIKEN
ncbi:MAG: toll/interleukin-1 receptor domain-containing protein [Acidobacteriota bacterium]|nr:toll/interleukin-1 receptor domain-containing protein [Acidobacteriota bacterium]